MAINLFVGDNGNYLAKIAQKTNSAAFLIEHSNYKIFLSSDYTNDITVYTSFSDLPKISHTDSIFFEVLKKADNIFYCPPEVWSDYSFKFSWNTNRTITEYLLYHINLIKNNVRNLDLVHYQKSNYLNLIEYRKTENRQLWIAGCSIAHGVGVDPEEKFGTIISNKINLPVSHLTKGGTSLDWAKDQILRSDVRKNDIVIWELTQEVRAPKVINGMLWAERNPDILLEETSLYRAVTSVYQVVNFCSKISAQLLLLPINCSERLELLIHHLDEYYQLPYQLTYSDLGTDRVHPGPIQHQVWADIIYKKLADDGFIVP
jgi:hypothetical protein